MRGRWSLWRRLRIKVRVLRSRQRAAMSAARSREEAAGAAEGRTERKKRRARGPSSQRSLRTASTRIGVREAKWGDRARVRV